MLILLYQLLLSKLPQGFWLSLRMYRQILSTYDMRGNASDCLNQTALLLSIDSKNIRNTSSRQPPISKNSTQYLIYDTHKNYESIFLLLLESSIPVHQSNDNSYETITACGASLSLLAVGLFYLPFIADSFLDVRGSGLDWKSRQVDGNLYNQTLILNRRAKIILHTWTQDRNS